MDTAAAYQVLARKWRPRRFEDVVGQDHVIRVLRHALDKNRLHHAYLYSGTRGVGKTTFARIFAKALNCEVGISSKPCDQCAACRAIDAGQFLDLYEIDAASRTKVEDTRDLLENISYPPAQGRFKVYLIDEVHMLSTHSFNALLKTLEEPPAHVKFLFATTEPKRLPITILSRCLQFHLKPISAEQIAAQLQRICASEEMTYEEAALTQLAVAADGSMRDALSLLDQAIVFSEGNIKLDEVNQLLGQVAQVELIGLLEALAAQDVQKLFVELSALHQRAPDYQQILAELINLLHQTAVVQAVPNWKQPKQNIQDLAKKFTPEEVQLYYQIALLGRKDLPLVPSAAQGFEMLMLRMHAFHPSVEPNTRSLGVAQRNPGEQRLSPPGFRCATPRLQAPGPALGAAGDEMGEPVNRTHTEMTSAPPKAELTTEGWKTLLPKLGLTHLAYALANNCNLGKITADKVELILSLSYKAMANPKQLDRIEQALSQYFGKKFQLSLTITEEAVNSPAKQFTEEQDGKKASALASFQQDPGVQKIQDLFNATLDLQSLDLGE